MKTIHLFTYSPIHLHTSHMDRNSPIHLLTLLPKKQLKIELLNRWTIIFLIFFLQLVTTYTKSQVINLPINHQVYSFLERASLKNIIDFTGESLPISRKKAARYLRIISINRDKLNNLEVEELEWYRREFKYELSEDGIPERFFAYSYTDSLFRMRVTPVAGYSQRFYSDENGFKRWWGISLYSSISDWFGMFVDMRDHGEFNGAVDRKKVFSPETGASIINPKGGIEYSDVRGGLSIDWKWGSLSFQKDYFTLGSGKFGQLIHSTKAPSYPYIRFDIHPVDWLRFYYMHGWLNSTFIDSLGYYNRTSTLYKSNAQNFVNKYIAINMLSITPFDNIDFSLGNSSVYKGEFKPEMMIPFLFFKYLDRDLGKGSIEDGNGQFYFDLSVRYPELYKFYGTLFVDVIEIRNIFKNDWHNTWFGFTLGGKRIDLIIDNLDLTLEYTRVNPWVYEHKDSTTTYKHLNFDLGHWLGQNADQFRVQLDYLYMRGLSFNIFAEFIRKGGLKDISFAYGEKTRESFLYGPVRKEKRIGFTARYEYMHDLAGEFKYSYNDITDEDKSRTYDWMLGSKHSLSLTLSYGL